MNLLDITHRLLAGRSMGKVNQGIAKEQGKSDSNPYGIPTDYPLPPEAYGNAGPPPGYSTYTGATGGAGTGIPPEASGVIPGPAYPNMPSFGGEPTVIVNQPYQDPGVPEPAPYVPPEWVYPGSAANVTASPPEANLAPVQQQENMVPVYPGPGYTDPREANSMIGALQNWNYGNMQGNISDPEMAGMGGALAARFGLSGVQGGGLDYRRHIR